MVKLKEVDLQQFWIKIIIILSSALSVHTALAVPLFILLNDAHKTPSLLVDSPLNPQLSINESISLPELVQHKIVELLVKELQQLTNKQNECSLALTRVRVNAAYIQFFQQQKSVYSAVQAQHSSCFQTQASYQAERQKIALHTS